MRRTGLFAAIGALMAAGALVTEAGSQVPGNRGGVSNGYTRGGGEGHTPSPPTTTNRPAVDSTVTAPPDRSSTAATTAVERIPLDVRTVVKTLGDPNVTLTPHALSDLQIKLSSVLVNPAIDIKPPQVFEGIGNSLGLKPGKPGTGDREYRVDPDGPGTRGIAGGPAPATGGIAVVASAASLAVGIPADPAIGWPAQYGLCSKAVSELNAIVRTLGLENRNTDPVKVLRETTEEKRAAFRTKAAAYDSACLTNGAVPPPALARSAGILTVGDQLLCSGLLINRNTVLTARHCFVSLSSGEPIAENKPANGSVRFHRLDPSAASIRVVEYRENETVRSELKKNPGVLRPVDTPADYVFARLEKAVPDAEALPLGTAAIGDGLVVFGVNHTVYLAHLVASGSAFGDQSIVDKDHLLAQIARLSVRWDRAPLCRVMQRKDSCFYHLCQTHDGYSGSPVLRINAAARRFELAGVHTGNLPTSRKEDGCSMDMNGFSNLGTAFADDVTRVAAEKDWDGFVGKLGN